MKTIRLLIVEDDATLLADLKKHYRALFQSLGFSSVVAEQAESAAEAKQLAKDAKANPYDLVSLDVNLGDAALTGLDVLAAFHRFQSAWMVALLTGVEADATLDATVGRGPAAKLRKQLRRDAYARFPAERLMVVEKPLPSLPPNEGASLLRNRLNQIALVYEEVSRLRYIFRPIEVTSLERALAPRQPKSPPPRRKFIPSTALHWQIRFNCGDLRTLPDKTGFKTLHHLLSLDPDQSLTPEAAMAIEPCNEQPSATGTNQPSADPLAEYFVAQGIEWNTVTPERQDEVIRAALSLRLKRYVELREFEEQGDLSSGEENDLSRIKREFGPLADMAEAAYQRVRPQESPQLSVADSSPAALAQNNLHPESGNYYRREGGRGEDSPEAQRFRTRKKRVCDCLRENGFADFAKHVEEYVMSTGANWSYNPPDNIEWTL